MIRNSASSVIIKDIRVRRQGLGIVQKAESMGRKGNKISKKEGEKREIFRPF